MRTYKVGYFVGSLSSTSINRVLSKALIRLAREDLEFRAAHRQPAVVQPGLRQRLPGGTAGVEGRDPRFGCRPVHDPGVQPLDPGSAEKTNVIDWASRPWGKHSFDHMSAAVIGASPGQIGTAVGQQSLRGSELLQCASDDAPEAYISFKPGLFTDDGEVTDESTAAVLADFMQEFRDHVERDLTVLPRRGHL